jgi:uncharacterized membrane protein
MAESSIAVNIGKNRWVATSLSVVAFISFWFLLWGMIGTVWDPLAEILRVFQKAVGFLAVVFFFAFLFSQRVRRESGRLIDDLEVGTGAERRLWMRLVFFSLGCALSFLAVYKHNSLQSHTHDLGIFLNVTWNMAHGYGFYDPIIHARSFLGDHWGPVFLLFAPVVRVWPDARPFFVVQAFSIALGAMGIYFLGKKIIGGPRWAALIAFTYVLHPYVHKLHSFDFHPESLSIPLLIWGLYFVWDEKPWVAFGLFSLTWFVKEDFPIVTFGIALFLVLATRHKRMGTVLAVGSLVVFVLIATVLMPHFLGETNPTHLVRYQHLGSSLPEVVKTIILSPHKVLADVLGDWEIWATALFLLIPFFFLPIIGGPLIVASLVAWAPHVVSCYSGQRHLTGPYSAASVSFLAISSCLGLRRLLQSPTFKEGGAWLTRVGPLPFATVALVHWAFAVPRYSRPTQRIRVEAFHRVRKLIPRDASVCAQGDLGPHVAFRHTLTQFPDIFGADYILLEPAGNTWAMVGDGFDVELERVRKSADYELIRDEEGFLLFKRVNRDAQMSGSREIPGGRPFALR